MQVKEIFIWEKKNERNTGEFRYSMTIITSSVANQNVGFALVR